MRGTVQYSVHDLTYRLRFSARKTLAITVHPDGAIDVVAPRGTARREVEARVRKRGRWILRQRRHFEQFRPRSPKRRYVGGETHLYLGRQYRLKLIRAEREEVKLKAGLLRVATPNHKGRTQVKRLVVGWYRDRARVKLVERFDTIVKRFKIFGRTLPAPILRSMPRRWGSCSNGGRVLLNPDLIRAPTACIDYVITHELIHVLHPHHGSKFHDLLETLMPDWRSRKTRLERVLS